MHADIQAYLIGKFNRPHWHAEVFRGTVDRLGLDAFVQHDKGLHQIGRERAIDQESWCASYWRWQAINAAEECVRHLQYVGGHAIVTDDLYQLHARNRVEEV